MAPAVDHHHRSTTKAGQKSFKSRHLTKSALKDRAKGNVEPERGIRRTKNQQIMSKLDRRNQAKQKRLTNHQDHLKTNSVFAGKDGAPRLVAVVPLCQHAKPAEVVRRLNASVDLDEHVPEEGWVRVQMDRFKQKIAYMVVKRELVAALDACRVADFVVVVLSATEEVDEAGQAILKTIESQGISNVYAVVDGLSAIEPAKRRPQVAASLKSFMTHFYPTLEKVQDLETRQECLNLLRSLCTVTPKGVQWRESRTFMMVEDVRWPGSKDAINDTFTGDVIVTGVIRGKGLKADRLVQVGDWGDFQIGKITAAPLPVSRKAKGEAMTLDVDEDGAILELPSVDRDDLNEFAPEEATMVDINDTTASLAPGDRKGVLIDDHHYLEDEYEAVEEIGPRRMPKGTSKYQAAWYIDDVSDSGSDLEDVDMDAEGSFNMDGSAHPADGVEGFDLAGVGAPTEGGPSEYPQSEMFLDPSPEDEEEELAAYRSQRNTDAEEDLEFPDEIELHPNVLARERLARYRGLKSLRSSAWEPEEDKPYEPQEWSRLLEIANYKAARHRVMSEALVGGVSPGTRVHVHLRGVPISLQQAHSPLRPLALFSLLRHEHKRTAANYSITLSSDLNAPLRSKEEIIIQCGPRRFIINPLFSDAGNTKNDVHRFNRYLHPGRSAIASFIGPLTWGSVPALFFMRTPPTAFSDPSPVDNGLTLIGTGTSLPPSLNRVIAKRIILTGHPYKIHKKIVTVRYMFFNKEDVAWFKALQLWTKRGRSGFIKESLGTHGYFKATFDAKINPMDSVAVSLYKRVWPRQARAWGNEKESGNVEEAMVENE